MDRRDDGIEAWVSAWSTHDVRGFAELYGGDGAHVDHAFNLRRHGRRSLEDHMAVWLRSFPDFAMSANRIVHGGKISVLRYLARGTFVKDLPSLQATKQPVQFAGIALFEWDSSRTIDLCEEFYTLPHG